MKTSNLRAAILMAGFALASAIGAVAQGTLGFTATTASVTEGTATITLNVSRTNSSAGAVAVSFATANGSASAGSDFTANNGTLNWANGDSANKSIQITIANDSNTEFSENFTVTLSNPTGGATLNGSATTSTVTILDNETATLRFQAAPNPITVAEEAGSVTLTVERLGLLTSAVNAGFNTSPLAGVSAGADYTAVTGTLSWPANDGTSKTIVVPIVDDSDVEMAFQDFAVNLSSATTISGSNSANIRITDNDSTFGFLVASGNVGESSGPLTVNVTRLGDTSRAGSVQVSTLGSTAASGGDYVALSGQIVNFTAGTSSVEVPITILQDTAEETDETFTVTLSNPTQQAPGSAVLSAPATGFGSSVFTALTATITDDDGAIALVPDTNETNTTPVFGTTVVLSSTFTGATVDAGYTAAWTRDSTPIISGGRYAITTSNPTTNSTKVTLTITDVNASDNGAYNLAIDNTLGESVSFGTSVTVTQTATTRDPGTSSLGVSLTSSTHRVQALLHLPDGRTLAAVNGTINGTSGTSVAAASGAASVNLVVINVDGTVSNAGSGVFGNAVGALYRLPDGKILVSGAFTTAGGSGGAGRTYLARLNADLTLDTTFAPSPVPNSDRIDRIETDAAGRILLGGNFNNYGGVEGQNGLVRLFPNGVLDRSFTRGVAANGDVNAIVRQPDGKILVAGSFGALAGDGLPVPGIYRLNADGTLDTGFTPPAFSGSRVFDSMLLDSEDRIVLAQSNPDNTVFRLLSSGAADSTFLFSNPILASATTTFGARVNALALLPGDKILVAGQFTKTTKAAVDTAANRLVLLNADGTRDSGYPVTAALTWAGTNFAESLSVAPSGRVWLTGNFTTHSSAVANRVLVLEGVAPVLAFRAPPLGQTAVAGETATFTAIATGDNGFTFAWAKDGETLSDGGRISGATTGTLRIANVTASDAGDYTVTVTSPTAGITSDPAALEVVTAPEILVSPVDTVGDFFGSVTLSVQARGQAPLNYQWFKNGVSIGGATSSSLTLSNLGLGDAGQYDVTVTNGADSVVSETVLVTVNRRPGVASAGLPSISIDNDEVFAILTLPDGSVLVGGSFTSVTAGGVTSQRNRIARFLSNGTLDASFNPTFSSNVRALARDAAGRIYVGGDFTTVNFGSGSVTRNRVARLASDLTLDATFATTGSAGATNNSVFALAPVGDGSVFIGGSFTTVGGVSTSAVKSLARLSNTGALDATFTSGATGDVRALAYDADNSVLFAGGASNTWSVGGDSVSSARLVKLSLTGSRSSFTSPATTIEVRSLLLTAEGDLLVGGGTGTTTGAFLKRVSTASGADTNPAYVLTGQARHVAALAEQSDGKIIAVSFANIQRTNALGVAETGFGVFSNQNVNAVAIDTLGRIWAGGAFGTYAGSAANGLVVLTGGDASSSLGSLTPQVVTFPAIPGRVYDPAATTISLTASADSDRAIIFSRVSGPATVSGSTLTITGTGTITVRALAPAGSGFAAASEDRTFTVLKRPQVITFPAIPNKSTSSPAFELGISSDSGLDVVITPDGPITLEGQTATTTGVGTVTITATQTGNSLFAAASPVVRTFTVSDTPRLAQTITFNQPAPRTFGTVPSPVSFSTSARGLTPTLTVLSGPATVGLDGRTLTLTGAGNVVLRVSHDGNDTFAAATPVTRTLVVNKAPQNITFNVASTVTLGDTAPALAATASSGLDVSYAIVGVSTIASLEDDDLTFSGAGKVTIRATQAGDDDYLAATPVNRTITIKTPSLVISNLRQSYTGSPLPVSVTGQPSGFVPVVTYQLGSAPATEVAPTNVGSYKVVASLGTATRTATLVIAKRVLTVTPENVTVKVGTTIPTSAADPDFYTLNYTGFVDGESEDDLADTRPVARSTATNRSNAGTYPITVSGGVDTNYSFAYGRGSLTLVGLGGTYEALVVDPVTTLPVGQLTLTMLNNSFGYTGSLSLAAESSPITIRSGAPTLLVNPVLTANEEGTSATGTWSRAATSTLPALALTVTVNNSGAFTGTLTRGGESFGILANGRELRTATTGAPGQGAYTMSIVTDTEGAEPGSLPEGTGHATGTINARGSLSLKGRLPDGTALTTSAKMDDEGNHRVYVRPYGSRAGNRFAGFLGYTTHGVTPSLLRVSPTAFSWFKPAGTDAIYAGGIDEIVGVRLEPWQRPTLLATTAMRLGLAGSNNVSGNFDIDFTSFGVDAIAPTTLPESRTLLPNNRIAAVLAAQNPSQFTLSLTSTTDTTGAFTGSFKLVIPPSTAARTINFTGVLFQTSSDADRVVGRGLFILPANSASTVQTTGEILFTRQVIE